jgi:hypothetical protein
MKRLKSLNELFDSEELKGEYEVPYLTGDLTSSLRKIKLDSKSLMNKVFWKFPVLERFHKQKVEEDGLSFEAIWATSLEPIASEEFYAQLAVAFVEEDKHYVSVIFRGLDDYDDESKWLMREFSLDKIEEVFQIVESFIKTCNQLNIIKDEDLESSVNWNKARSN